MPELNNRIAAGLDVQRITATDIEESRRRGEAIKFVPDALRPLMDKIRQILQRKGV